VKAFTVLIVDDDPDMRLYLRGCLRGLGDGGATVLEAADGTEALRLFTSSPVDLVISDVILPRLDGRSLLQAIRSGPARRHVPVLLISGQEQAGPADGAAAAWLPKPFNARQLLTAVEQLLARGFSAPGVSESDS
jgi:CheY-like chemotaxis protein